MNDEVGVESELLDLGRLRAKVEWEGGVFEALRYGVRARHLADRELTILWAELEARYEALADLAADIERRLACS